MLSTKLHGTASHTCLPVCARAMIAPMSISSKGVQSSSSQPSRQVRGRTLFDGESSPALASILYQPSLKVCKRQVVSSWRLASPEAPKGTGTSSCATTPEFTPLSNLQIIICLSTPGSRLSLYPIPSGADICVAWELVLGGGAWSRPLSCLLRRASLMDFV